jgi:hypothetical protein
MVSDAGGSVPMQGTPQPITTWILTFITVDTDELTTNSYHVSIDSLPAEPEHRVSDRRHPGGAACPTC